MKKIQKFNVDFTNSIKILLSPVEDGFACGILVDTHRKLDAPSEHMCTTIARGMIRMATRNPHETFLEGIKGFHEDSKRSSELGIQEGDLAGVSKTNLVDFMSYLKKRKFKKEDLN